MTKDLKYAIIYSMRKRRNSLPICPLRLVVRTLASQANDVGSIPAGDGKQAYAP